MTSPHSTDNFDKVVLFDKDYDVISQKASQENWFTRNPLDALITKDCELNFMVLPHNDDYTRQTVEDSIFLNYQISKNGILISRS